MRRYCRDWAFYMKTKRINNGSAPLEIPKRALLETQVNPVRNLLLTRLEILISNGVKQSLTGRRFLTGSVLLMTIFVIALLSALTMGILQMSTEEIQLMQNQTYAAEAIATAEAGLNDSFAQIRADDEWATGFDDKAFNSGSYDVNVTGTLPNLTITSTGTSSQSFVGRVEADVTVDTSGSSDHTIRIDNLRINE